MQWSQQSPSFICAGLTDCLSTPCRSCLCMDNTVCFAEEVVNAAIRDCIDEIKRSSQTCHSCSRLGRSGEAAAITPRDIETVSNHRRSSMMQASERPTYSFQRRASHGHGSRSISWMRHSSQFGHFVHTFCIQYRNIWYTAAMLTRQKTHNPRQVLRRVDL